MAFSEKTISRQIIKPISPTPKTLRTHELSFLDQLQPPIYMPIVFFYESDPIHHEQVAQSLKQSLSYTLTLFYPLAGKLQDNSFIDCDDSGIDFIEARLHAHRQHFQADPKTEELRQLVPADTSAHSNHTLMLVKLSFLDCGGFSVGVSWSHKLMDYSTFVMFMNAWATTCRGQTPTHPSFDLALRFPPKKSAPVYFSGQKDEIITKRLVFNKEMMERIRVKEGSSSEVKKPSRVEALSAFIWKIFIEATKAKGDPNKTSFAAFHAINLRSRTVPPIPDSTFGNCYVGTFAFASDESDVMSNLRAAIKEVDDGFVKNVINDSEYLKQLDDANQRFKRGETELFNFSSWWRFPVYDVDYGWGKPAWVCTVAMPRKNLVRFMSTPSGDGIEAWINMPQQFSEIFETSYDNIIFTT